ncbi:MAG: MFS transporter [Planctomycetota bacterium]
MTARPALPRVVFVLGAVSFCADLASEMIVPLLPALVASLGGGMLQLGLLQGLSDLAVAALKIVSGRWSDRQRRRKPWILGGYLLSALLRPLFAIVGTPAQAVLVRIGDRVGKGLRSAPRDALLTAAVPADQRGHAFGVQRALDHAGALAGALLASGLLALGCELRLVFALALVPGLLAVVTIVTGVRDVEAPPAAVAATQPWPRGLAPLLAFVGLSAVSAGVDLFALALAAAWGTPTVQLPLLWALLHVTRSSLAAPLGRWSDTLGRRRVIALGLLFHALVLLGFASCDAAWAAWPLFALLGLHAAFTEGAERGLVADRIGPDRRGAAFGVYHAVQGLAACLGAVLLGFVWEQHGAPAAFVTAAGSAVLALVTLRFASQPRLTAAGSSA